MKKLIPQTGGHPFRLNDLMHVQDAVVEITTALSGIANAGNNYVLQGCAISGNNIASGWIYYNGEIYKAVGATLSSPLSGQTLHWNIVQVTEDTVTLTSPYNVQYQDLVYKGVHIKRTMVPVWATSGTVADAALPRIINTIINGGVNPIGAIQMWTGNVSLKFSITGLGISDLTGWALCNGQNGTADLRSRFIVGYDPAVTDYNALAKVGGTSSTTLAIANLPAHNHPITFNPVSGTTSTESNPHTHNFADIANYSDERKGAGAQDAASSGESTSGNTTYNNNQNHTHTFSFTPTGSVGNTGGGTSFENRPPYYTLAFIQRIS